ncbi:putative transcription elongation factor 1 [Helianthus annuus]|nr:putative transcription elongation factor 1 [Helianthus annuus]
MGKRKSRAKPPPKKRMDKLDTVFSCPFCNHGTSVECRIDMKNLIGEASCRICQENFSTTVTGIISVFSVIGKSIKLKEILIWYMKNEWIDECERVNNVDDDGVPVEDDID